MVEFRLVLLCNIIYWIFINLSNLEEINFNSKIEQFNQSPYLMSNSEIDYLWTDFNHFPWYYLRSANISIHLYIIILYYIKLLFLFVSVMYFLTIAFISDKF